MKETKPGNALRNVVNGPSTISEIPRETDETLDFAFLDAQTFGDAALAREVLILFIEQVRRCLPSLPNLAPAEQSATAHLLKGSCQGIGANAGAALLQRYDNADAAGRSALYPELSTVFAEVEAAITARLAAP